MKVPLEDFRLNSNLGIYVHEKVHATDYSDGSESHLLKVFEKVSDLTYDSDELQKYIIDWPTMYHIGKGRQTLRALNLPPNLEVLELGAGCGAVTRYLGEHFKSVCAIEGSIQRAAVLGKRCMDLTNVKVFVGDFTKIKFPKKI